MRWMTMMTRIIPHPLPYAAHRRDGLQLALVHPAASNSSSCQRSGPCVAVCCSLRRGAAVAAAVARRRQRRRHW